jgi:hypothetical protein
MTFRETPPRWEDDASADEFLQRLVRAGKHDGPSARALGAAPAAIGALLSAGSAGAAGTAGAAAAVKSTLSVAVLGKWFGAGVLAGAALMTATHGADLGRAPPKQPVEPVELSPAPVRATPTATEVSDVPPEPAPSAPPNPRPSARTLIAQEIALLDAARAELVAGDAAEALRLLDTLERLPGRSLGPEATVLRVRALLASGDASQAQRLAAAFYRRSPDSPQAAVLRSLLTAPRAPD